MAKILIIIGIILIVLGVGFQYMDRIPFFGKLPGDIVIDRPNLKVYVPITSSIILSVLITVIFYIINKMKN